MSRTLTPPVDIATAPARQSRTLRALIGAGKRLVSNGEIEAATIDDIARVADVSKRSFHNHFTDKDALVSAVLTEVRQDLESRIAEVNRGVDDMAADFARGMLVSFRYGMDNRLSERVMLHIARGVADPASQGNRILTSNLRKGMERGTFKVPSVDAGVVLVLALSDLGVSRLVRLRDERSRARLLMHDICVLLLRGLGVDARRIGRVVDDALAAVIDAPAEPARGQRLLGRIGT